MRIRNSSKCYSQTCVYGVRLNGSDPWGNTDPEMLKCFIWRNNIDVLTFYNFIYWYNVCEIWIQPTENKTRIRIRYPVYNWSECCDAASQDEPGDQRVGDLRGRLLLPDGEGCCLKIYVIPKTRVILILQFSSVLLTHCFFFIILHDSILQPLVYISAYSAHAGLIPCQTINKNSWRVPLSDLSLLFPRAGIL